MSEDPTTRTPRPTHRFERERDEEGRPANARPRDRYGRPLPRDADPDFTVEDFEFDSLDDALDKGVELWAAERFFEAHEVLEDVWHAAPEPDRLFWQGVIQVAVGCVHHQRGNPHGCVALWRKAADKLRGYPPTHHGIEVEALRRYAEQAAAAVEDAPELPAIEYPRLPTLPGGPWLESHATTEDDR